MDELEGAALQPHISKVTTQILDLLNADLLTTPTMGSPANVTAYARTATETKPLTAELLAEMWEKLKPPPPPDWVLQNAVVTVYRLTGDELKRLLWIRCTFPERWLDKLPAADPSKVPTFMGRDIPIDTPVGLVRLVPGPVTAMKWEAVLKEPEAAGAPSDRKDG